MEEIFYPVRKNDKYAFINNEGQLITNFDFDFANCYGGFRLNGKFGAIDNNGNILVKNQFDSLGGFYEGLAKAELNGKYGYINKSGEFEIEPKYYRTTDFINGFANVFDTIISTEKVIDKNDKEVFNGEWCYGKCKENLISCAPKGTQKFGFINLKNEFEIPPIYLSTRDFSEELAAVMPEFVEKKKNKKELFGFINNKNEMIIPPLYSLTDGYFSDGLCPVCNEKGEYGYLNKNGDVVIPFQFFLADNFSEGLAGVEVKKNNKNGFINRLGEFTIKPRFTHVGSFKNGIAEVIIGEDYDEYKYGYINKDGKYIWKPTR